MTGQNLDENLETFLRHIDSIRDTLPMTLLLLEPYNKKANKDFIDFLEKKTSKIIEEKGKKRVLIEQQDVKLFTDLERNASISTLARKIIHESLFVSLISQYDAFITRLLKAIFEIKPEILNSSEKNLNFSQLIEMKSIDNARNYIIDKEIDTILRKSHSEQFIYLEGLIGIKLRENLPIWQTFIEITERRNLLVHCDGVVSNQYIKNCKEHKCTIDKDLKVGDRLGVPIDYFKKAYDCLYEISVKLTHTIWRKLLPDDIENADKELNHVCFNLINAKAFKVADILLMFAYNQKKHFNDYSENFFIINGALSQFLQNQKDKAKEILHKKDWSACNDQFKLAYDILSENYEEAYRLMKRIGKTGSVKKSDYKEWPLFIEIRKEKKFKDTFKQIFKEEYSVLETPKRPVQELLSKRKEALEKNKSLSKQHLAKEAKKPIKKTNNKNS